MHPPATPQLFATVDVRVNTFESDLLLSKAEVAVILGWLLGDAGTEVGGTKVTLVGATFEREPQAGEHAEPLAVRVQFTLGVLLGSYWIFGLKLTPAPPSKTKLTLVILTATG